MPALGIAMLMCFVTFLQFSASFVSFAPMEREIRARIGTARLLLDRVAGDPTALAAASRTQAIALVDAIRRAKQMDRVAVGELAQNVQLAASDAMTVASAFQDRGVQGRMPLQDFQHLPDYFLRASGLVCVRRTHRT